MRTRRARVGDYPHSFQLEIEVRSRLHRRFHPAAIDLSTTLGHMRTRFARAKHSRHLKVHICIHLERGQS